MQNLVSFSKMGSVRFLYFDFDDSRSAPISTFIDYLFNVQRESVGPIEQM